MPEKDMAGNESSPFTFVIRHRHRHNSRTPPCTVRLYSVDTGKILGSREADF